MIFLTDSSLMAATTAFADKVCVEPFLTCRAFSHKRQRSGAVFLMH